MIGRFVASRRRMRRRSGELRRLRNEDRGQVPDASGFEQLARTVRHVFRVRRPAVQVVLLPSQWIVLQKRLRQVTCQRALVRRHTVQNDPDSCYTKS